jgi:hypothetical protein
MSKYKHYYKTLPCLNVDVYRVLLAFEVTDPCLQHAAKKILCAGGRGAKDAKKDVEEAIDSLVRWLEMRREEGENMQGNNLKVSICDSLNLAESFLYDMRQTELAYGETLKENWSESDENRMRVVISNGNDGEVYKVNDGWIEWRGGNCPVGDDVIVAAKLRDMTGHVEEFRCQASAWMWNHQGDGSDIIAYKIVDGFSSDRGDNAEVNV